LLATTGSGWLQTWNVENALTENSFRRISSLFVSTHKAEDYTNETAKISLVQLSINEYILLNVFNNNYFDGKTKTWRDSSLYYLIPISAILSKTQPDFGSFETQEIHEIQRWGEYIKHPVEIAPFQFLSAHGFQTFTFPKAKKMFDDKMREAEQELQSRSFPPELTDITLKYLNPNHVTKRHPTPQPASITAASSAGGTPPAATTAVAPSAPTTATQSEDEKQINELLSKIDKFTRHYVTLIQECKISKTDAGKQTLTTQLLADLDTQSQIVRDNNKKFTEKLSAAMQFFSILENTKNNDAFKEGLLFKSYKTVDNKTFEKKRADGALSIRHVIAKFHVQDQDAKSLKKLLDETLKKLEKMPALQHSIAQPPKPK
jgi:hypothetical protein